MATEDTKKNQFYGYLVSTPKTKPTFHNCLNFPTSESISLNTNFWPIFSATISSMNTTLISLLILVSALVVSLVSYRQTKKGSFYSLTPWLFAFGIYVWGDGLILGPFWVLASFFFFTLNSTQFIRFLLVFYLIRSTYEIIYWLNHQATNSDYKPPMPKLLSFLDPGQSAILYQLIHTCIVIFASFMLISNFS